MNDVAIHIENLSKSYVIGHQRNEHDGLRHQIEVALRNPVRWLSDRIQNRHAKKEEFWALKDVSFDIQRGEALGIIGRNGAGKSTLLKILSRITEPTTGRVRIKGRVASLLEVGTGFHVELTGRENIFLNGAILGMSKTEIKKKFDEIVAFSEVEKFLDMPVKRYSSGMFVRLAFAVAAHLEPEILIVDEVLAVGDAEFQKKCLGKMKDVSSNEGRTVLFVSHNMAAVGALCRKGVVLESGKIVYTGEVVRCMDFYQSRRQISPLLADQENRPGSGTAKYTNIHVLGFEGRFATTIHSGEKLEVVFEIGSKKPIDRVLPGVNLANTMGQRIATLWGGFTDKTLRLNKGHNRFLLFIDRLDLSPGKYSLTATLGLDGETLDVVEDVLEINVAAPTRWSPSRYPILDHGPLFPAFNWTKI